MFREKPNFYLTALFLVLQLDSSGQTAWDSGQKLPWGWFFLLLLRIGN